MNSIITKNLVMLKNMVYSWKCKIDESIMMLSIKVGLINVGVIILSIMYVRGCYSVLVSICRSMGVEVAGG
ncbi:MAG: hypothetical protein LM583_04100 [Desulfurococcaceae archaeon]|nr:hypothetical protein [Desulfurococcaceae archaeon]